MNDEWRSWALPVGALLAALVWLPALAGCGGSGIDRVEVSGTVTFDGKPLEQGSIEFQPIAAGPSAGGKIAGGEFTIAEDQGPSPGSYRVEIRSYQPTGRKVPDPDFPGKMEEEKRNVVPKRYNDATTLQKEITAEGPNRFAFELTAR